MKKLSFILISASIFIGCASKQPLDPCVAKENACLSQCKIDYPDGDFKYKACKAKCYTIYNGCKLKQKISKGYQKTKEFIKEKTN